MAEHTSYYYDIGSSDLTPIGAVIRVCALSKEEAFDRIQDLVPNDHEIASREEGFGDGYLTVFFNHDKLTMDGFCDALAEDCDCEEYDGDDEEEAS